MNWHNTPYTIARYAPGLACWLVIAQARTAAGAYWRMCREEDAYPGARVCVWGPEGAWTRDGVRVEVEP
jgi:hypothetical protein